MQLFMPDGEWNEDEYGDLVAECKKLSLLQSLDRRADGVQFSLHPVVGDWLKVRKERRVQLRYHLENFSVLAWYIHGVDFPELDLHVKEETLLHVGACMQNDWETESDACVSFEGMSYCRSLFALCYESEGQFGKLETMYKRTLADLEEKQGPDHPHTLKVMQKLAAMLPLNKRADAEKLLKRALPGCEKNLGSDHPITRRVRHDLASIYSYKEQYDDAEELIKRLLAYKQQDQGPDHLDTLAAATELSMVFADEKRYDEAEELLKSVISGFEKSLGPDHVTTLVALLNLAIIYAKEEHYNDAEELGKRVLAVREKKFRPDHPDTLYVVRHLACVLLIQGKKDEATSLLDKFGCTLEW